MTDGRRATVRRETAETAIAVTLDLDGGGRFAVATGIGFLDHMIAQIARHGVEAVVTPGPLDEQA